MEAQKACMIAKMPEKRPAWRIALEDLIGDAATLARHAGLATAPDPVAADAGFRCRVPRAFADRIIPGDAADPLLHQVLPRAIEADECAGFGPDPVGDAEALRARGLLHKYHGRVLLILTGACAIHCRYCFRRHFPYAEQALGRADLDAALAVIAGDPSIHEVILSGGDPLMLPDARLAQIARSIESLAHVRRLRLHTRMPVVLPDRVDADLIAWLSKSRLPVTVVVHANHAHEIDTAVTDALRRLRDAGVTLLNQSVLLRGVNDSVDALVALSERLFAAGALPYYLHLLDRVTGAAHFEVPEDEAKALHAALCARLPGYLVPRLVREVAGEKSKTCVR